jgi:hypothetical protein
MPSLEDKNKCVLIPECDEKFPNCDDCDKYSTKCLTCQEYFMKSADDDNKCIINCAKKFKNCSDCKADEISKEVKTYSCTICQEGYYQSEIDCIKIPVCDVKFNNCKECDK